MLINGTALSGTPNNRNATQAFPTAQYRNQHDKKGIFLSEDAFDFVYLLITQQGSPQPQQQALRA